MRFKKNYEKDIQLSPKKTEKFDIDKCKKSEIIDLILEKYDSYSEEDLKDLKKEVLIMTYKGDI